MGKFARVGKRYYLCTRNLKKRGVAQSGSAPGLGPGGRRFESCRPDKDEALGN